MSSTQDTRGAHLLDAVLEVVAGQGLQATSMRSVVTAAGVSLAQVQYYFTSKAGLLQAADEHAKATFLGRIDGLDGLDGLDGVEGLAALRAVVELWLPLDEERDRRAHVWLAYAAASANDAGLAHESARLDRELRAWLTTRFSELAQTGEVGERRAPSVSAATLLALVDGVTVQSFALAFPARRALAESTVLTWLDEQSLS